MATPSDCGDLLSEQNTQAFKSSPQGKVNKLGISHVGCLVHGCFNASLPRPNLVPVETWRDAGPRIGAELEFEVVALDADAAGVLLIRGRLDRTRQVSSLLKPFILYKQNIKYSNTLIYVSRPSVTHSFSCHSRQNHSDSNSFLSSSSVTAVIQPLLLDTFSL